jgi:hypothetical protein
MIYQLKTFDDKILVELRIVYYGTELFTSNELSVFKEKINQTSSEQSLQFEKDLSSLNGIKKELVEEKFKELSENWGLKFKL